MGIAQDGGYPQAGCTKECCKAVYEKKLLRQAVSCIALIDPISNEKWIFDATPDFGEQLAVLNAHNTIIGKNPTLLDGIFLTHAHIGHYTGLMHLGREVIGAKSIKVFAMPKMKTFLETNGPWSQLVNLQNIAIQPINEDTEIYLNERLKIVPFRVPHRDEFSETVGFQIISKNKKMIFIPDIDKWQRWKQDLKTVIENNDILLLDGTFYKDGEINRPMSEVPHPFVVETMDLLKNIPIKSKNKVHFIHINHTNPILNSISKEYQEVILNGFGVCQIGQVFNF
ncbi:MAG: MBL fold metallo-hydrolase [Arcicella sp.]|nr:MBL fold metallo-hydrolase [Arcicella sp.]